LSIYSTYSGITALLPAAALACLLFNNMEDPAARRARLKALKEEAQAGGATPMDAAPAAAPARAEPPATQEPVLKFRNYAVRDEKLEHQKVSIDK
jgi:hypothetical protein